MASMNKVKLEECYVLLTVMDPTCTKINDVNNCMNLTSLIISVIINLKKKGEWTLWQLCKLDINCYSQ